LLQRIPIRQAEETGSIDGTVNKLPAARGLDRPSQHAIPPNVSLSSHSASTRYLLGKNSCFFFGKTRSTPRELMNQCRQALAFTTNLECPQTPFHGRADRSVQKYITDTINTVTIRHAIEDATQPPMQTPR
jgi:hypothetical protein